MKDIDTLNKSMATVAMTTQFMNDVDQGLSSKEKTLPSKYFYDKIGDALFVQIMHLPEYYVTRAEHEIFKNQSLEIISALNLDPDYYFELIELGAGDGTKTKELLKELTDGKYKFDYMPVDISQNALDNLETDLQDTLADVSVQTKQGDYFEVLQSLKENKRPKVILFLGSNIGNMDDETAADFISKLSNSLQENDKVFLGVDLIKEESVVLPAYDDSQGITAAFNLNLLTRINNELDADFDLGLFEHRPEYKESDGIAKSYLVSTTDQEVYIASLNKTFHFAREEKILMEISRKYNDEILNTILSDTRFEIKTRITDSQKYFANYVLEVK